MAQRGDEAAITTRKMMSVVSVGGGGRDEVEGRKEEEGQSHSWEKFKGIRHKER